MGRGYLWGLLVGGLASLIGLAGVSLTLPAVRVSVADNGAGQEAEAPLVAEAEPQAEPEQGSVEVADAPEPSEPSAPVKPEQPESVVEAPPVVEPAAEPAVEPAAEPAAEPTAEPAAEPTVEAAVESAVESAAEPAAVDSVAVDSVATEPAETAPLPETPVVEVPAGSEFARAKPEEQPRLPAPGVAPSAGEAPVVAAPEAESDLKLTDISPALEPEDLPEPPAIVSAPEISQSDIVADAPSVETPAPDAAALPVLADESQPDSAAQSGEPAEAPTVPKAEVVAEEPVAVPEPVTNALPEPVTSPDDGTKPAGATEIAEALPEPEPEPELAPAPEPQVAPEPEAAEPAATEAATAEPVAQDPVLPETDEAPADEAPADEATAASESGPVILEVAPLPPIGVASAPQPGFAQRTVPGVQINRLPRIGDEAAANDEAQTDGISDGATEAADGGSTKAATRYAARFDNTDARPLVAVVIADLGEASGGVSADTLAAISVPVTIAINPEDADAAARATVYRLAGHEVAILAPELPRGATASDLEVSYQSYARSLPESVALVGAPDALFQSNRQVAQHLVSLLETEGRGLVTYDSGLNPARQAAAGAGLPHAVIYRALDGSNETGATIQRYLDRAAFEAARSGRIVVAGSSTAETVNALLDWIAGGAKGSAVGPVSAVMNDPE